MTLCESLTQLSKRLKRRLTSADLRIGDGLGLCMALRLRRPIWRAMLCESLTQLSGGCNKAGQYRLQDWEQAGRQQGS